jgi:hypothetical protein
MKNSTLSVVIPCLNESSGIKHVLQNMPNIVSQVVVVDGDSSDDTVDIANKQGAKVIIEKKKGYGLALRTGFNNSSADYFVTLDGDRTYPVEDIPKLYNYALKNKVDFLVACRFPLKHRDSMTVKNFFGNLFISSITSLIFNFQATDICSGMMIISRKAWELLGPRVKDNKWFFSNEIKIEAIKDKKIKYDEHWIELRTRSGTTKVGNVWLIGLKVLLSTFRKRFF